MTGSSIPILQQGSIFHVQVKNNCISQLITPKIINISSFDLTKQQISLLSKGLNFCPTPAFSDFLDLEVNLRDFIRLLLLKDNFSSFTDTHPDYLVKKTGQTLPNDSKDMLFNGVIFHIRKLSEQLEKLPVDESAANSNLTSGEQHALNSLRNNSDIVIKKVDKGGGIVIMDSSFYVAKVNECLRNGNVYKKCQTKAINTAMNKVISFVDKHKKYFDNKNCESHFIKFFDHNAASFYGLPKIHKSLNIQEQMKNANNVYLKMPAPTDLPFRFITAGPSSPTSRLSEFLDILLKPFLAIIPSYIRDYTDFLNKMPHFTTDEIRDIVIVTCDVRDMYNNITRNLGKKAIQYWLTAYPHLLHTRFDVDFVTQALDIVLDNSHFMFNEQCYNLTCGTATGTTVAPTYANLTMGFLEVELYEKVFLKYGAEAHDYIKIYWKRFLDDGQIMWKKSFGPVEEFVEILNSLDRNIIFTHESSDKSLSFLNVLLYIENNKLLTDVYYKNTDSHDYLPFSSCHPRHIKANIPKTLARIICTIVQDPDRKLQRLSELKTWLLKAGYPCGLINKGFSQILQIDQLSLRTKTVKDQEKILPFVQTHNPKNPQVYKYLLSAFNFLTSSEKYSNLFKDTRLIKSERQPKNLGRLLQKSFFSSEKPVWGVTRCHKSNCGTCSYLKEVDHFMFHRVKIDFKIRVKFTCESGNLIYVIICNGPCNSQYYIGSTCRLRDRVSNHKGVIKSGNGMKVHKHIADCTSNLAENEPKFTIIPFYKCKTKTFAQRVAVENYFRRKFDPPLNGY